MQPELHLYYCGFVRYDNDEDVEKLKPNSYTDGDFRKCHSALQQLRIQCTCPVFLDSKLALTKKFLYYTHASKLMRHELTTSLRKDERLHTDTVVLDTGKMHIQHLYAGSDFVSVTISSEEKKEVVVFLDDNTNYTLDVQDEIEIEKFVLGKKFGLLCTREKRLIRIELNGTKSKDMHMTPLRLPISSSVVDIVCGREHGIILTSKGRVFVIGGGTRGQLGNGAAQVTCKPDLVEALEPLKFRAVSAGGWHCLVLSEDGDLYGWGWNEGGQVGSAPCSNIDDESEAGTRENTTKLHFLPVLVNTPLSETFISLSTGARHSAAVTADGRLYTWGANGYGQLCHGNQDDVFTPLMIHCFKQVFATYCNDWGTLVCVKE